MRATHAGALMPHPLVPPSTDPFFANVVLLLHPDNPLVDKSSYAHTLTVANVTLEAATFQGNSLVMRSSSKVASVLDTAASSAFTRANGVPFTVEWSMRFNSMTAGEIYYFMGYTNAEYARLEVDASGTFGRLQTAFGLEITPILPNVWHQFACAYDGDVIRSFIDGDLATSEARGATLGTPGTPAFGVFDVASRHDLAQPLADITEVRLTNGVCRYTASYTPRPIPFPDS